MKIKKFIIKDVRCFEGRNDINTRLLTFLVGENSTGKTTLLGCLQALSYGRSLYSPGYVHALDFNLPPYNMGAFTDIVRSKTPKVKEFVLGFEIEYEKNKNFKHLITFCERENGSEPVVQKAEWEFEDGRITIKELEEQRDSIDIQPGAGKNEFILLTDSFRYYRSLIMNSGIIFGEIEYMLQTKKKLNKTWEQFRNFLKNKGLLGRELRHIDMRFDSIAPIRSEPKRTYDPENETPTPQGREVPMSLMNLYRSNKASWEQLKKQLTEFGESSGLFRDITVKTFDKSINNPFQIQIKVQNTRSNLRDVGYGVSQALPILVRILSRNRGNFLIQQPEVHLHPKGQAALASLMVNRIKDHQNSFVIETHSDYMIDRVRIEIREGNIPPDDVSLVYLEFAGNEVKAHNISFDKEANPLNTPPGYGEFFNKESDKLLGF